jgi:hypothetical protein
MLNSAKQVLGAWTLSSLILPVPSMNRLNKTQVTFSLLKVVRQNLFRRFNDYFRIKLALACTTGVSMYLLLEISWNLSAKCALQFCSLR